MHCCQFHQHFKSIFCADILAQKNTNLKCKCKKTVRKLLVKLTLGCGGELRKYVILFVWTQHNNVLTFLTTVWIVFVFSMNLSTVALSIFWSIFWLSGAPSTSNCQNTRLDSNKEYLVKVISNIVTSLQLLKIGSILMVLWHITNKRQ